MNNFYIFLSVAVAYLLGSIPTAVWYSKKFFGYDIREKGSGNAGAANTFRVLGKKAGSIVLTIDILKGWAAAMLAQILLNKNIITADQLPIFKLFFGFLAILGHLYPIFAQFKGGKGVATAFGLVIALQWQIAIICIVVFLVVLAVFHYTSLASMIGALMFPTMMLFEVFGKESPIVIAFGFLLAGVVIYTHRSNIGRLLSGNENKIYLFK